MQGSNGSTLTRIGAIAHELGPVLGSPDYYDVSSNEGGPDFIGSGRWDLMAGGAWNGGGVLPAHFNPHQKIKFGWITPKTILSGSTVTNIPPVETNPVVYRVIVNANGEHYLLENRQQVGFDTALPGHGLLIWHIAANVAESRPKDNHPLQVYPVCASSTVAIPANNPASYGNINDADCSFPGTSGKT